MQAEASVELACPIDEVFDFTNNHVVEWSITVVEDVVVSETPEHVGTTFRCVTEKDGKRMEFLGTVTHWEPPTLSAINLIGKSFDIQATYRFEDLDGRTRVTQHSVITPKGFMKVVFFLFSWMMGKAGCDEATKELENLKSILESRNASASS